MSSLEVPAGAPQLAAVPLGERLRQQGQLAPSAQGRRPLRVSGAGSMGSPSLSLHERWQSVINKGIDFPISALCILLAKHSTV